MKAEEISCSYETNHSPVWYLKVQKEESSLIRAPSGPSNASLPMTTMSIKRHCLNPFKWVSSQGF